MTDYITVLTTVGSEDEGTLLAEILVSARLAACVQLVGPITSVYRWQGKMEREKEFQLVAKSRGDLFAPLAELIKDNHSYEVPEIIAQAISNGSDAYLAWLDEQLQGESHGH
ncbi:MAG: divalent-cation tolerance protein CutA [Thermodesulfobacteriota bacterium]